MYKGLKPELEEIVDKIKIGDGIILIADDGHYYDRFIGYVYGKTRTRFDLRRNRDSNFFLENVFNWVTKITPDYENIADIKIVDSINPE